ncbi:MAG: tRNA (guanosine(37)-N1)-methyltransferase TrmD, partial [Candidatus Eremiobacteraeota bacterium]|nr:tRNA (guanosine(37)-N1)-methyltransferase TrmD [Candidatus Eremiobacteraeota bacterium]
MFAVDFITLLPEMLAPFIGLSIIGRAVESGLVEVCFHHVLDALEQNERADDTPYGGGPGMVMRLGPLARILDQILEKGTPKEALAIIMPSPSASRFKQSDARDLSKLQRLVFVCGHYEGIDDRLGDLYPIREFSLGDFVITGGELPALAFADATIRLVPGTLNSRSLLDESFNSAGLDYPSFTRPPVFRGINVPEVLLSGDHAGIAKWRRKASQARTRARR